MATKQTNGLDRRRLLQFAAYSLAPTIAPAALASTSYALPRASSQGEQFLSGKNPALIGPAPKLPPHKEGMIEVPQGQLSYLDTGGRGETVILVHASTGIARSWDYQIPALHAAGYRVIAYSRRGTQPSPSGVAPDNRLEVADLLALADGLGIARFHLVGTASGGFIAIRFAIQYAARLLSLTLSCSLLGLDAPELASTLDSLMPPGFNALPSEFKELSPSYRVANPAGVKRWLEIEAASYSAQMKLRPDATARMQRGVRGSDGPRLSDLEALHLPIHLIYGDADLYSPPAYARLLRPHLRGACLTVIGECGHASHWEQPENFNRALIGFLKG